MQFNLSGGPRVQSVRARDDKTRQLAEAHNRAHENSMRNRQRRTRRRQGTVRLSNTDSLSRARRIRQQLVNKISEVMSSNMEQESRMAAARAIQTQLDRVEMKIVQIRRRERAVQEEKRDRNTQERQQEERRIQRQREEARRRRRSDMRPRSIRISRGFLYHERDGGFSPSTVAGHGLFSSAAAVSFDVGGKTGVVMDTGGGGAGDTVNMVL